MGPPTMGGAAEKREFAGGCRGSQGRTRISRPGVTSAGFPRPAIAPQHARYTPRDNVTPAWEREVAHRCGAELGRETGPCGRRSRASAFPTASTATCWFASLRILAPAPRSRRPDCRSPRRGPPTGRIPACRRPGARVRVMAARGPSARGRSADLRRQTKPPRAGLAGRESWRVAAGTQAPAARGIRGSGAQAAWRGPSPRSRAERRRSAKRC